MTKAELIERYGIEWYEQYKERMNKRYRNDSEFRECAKARSKVRDQNNPEYQREYHKKYKKVDLNSSGKTKDYIRVRSNQILFKQCKHTRLEGYEIHHCFGYDDPSRFIYIPRNLHRAIHALLRDNNIDVDSNHYKYIANMINECTEYTYLSN